MAYEKWTLHHPYMFSFLNFMYTSFFLFSFLFLFLHHLIFLFPLYYSVITISVLLSSFRLWRRFLYVSTFPSLYLAWIFFDFSRFVLMVNETGFTVTVMASLDCWRLVARSVLGCIGVVVALSVVVTDWLVSTCLLYAVQKKSCMSVD